MSSKPIIIFMIAVVILIGALFFYLEKGNVLSPAPALTVESGPVNDFENTDLTGNTLDNKKQPEAIFEEPNLDNLPSVPMPPQISPSGESLN